VTSKLLTNIVAMTPSWILEDCRGMAVNNIDDFLSAGSALNNGALIWSIWENLFEFWKETAGDPSVRQVGVLGANFNWTIAEFP